MDSFVKSATEFATGANKVPWLLAELHFRAEPHT